MHYIHAISTDAVIGFDQTEVTVVEGEEVTLTTSFKNNVTAQTYLRSDFFTISTQQGEGNATGKQHSLHPVELK